MSAGPRFTATFDTVEHFLHAYDTEIRAGGLLVHGAQLGPHAAVGPCTLELRVANRPPAAFAALVAASVPNVGVAVLFSDPAPLRQLADALRATGAEAAPDGEAVGHTATDPGAEGDAADADAPDPQPPVPGTVSARLRAMTVSEKMQLALSADRETRGYLLRDTNKALHLYVLRNPRIGLDEVTYAAKLSTLAPEALKFIADHKEWGLNPTVCTAIARNPRSPVPLVLRILPRVPAAELRAIAKGNGRAPIVQAARKMVL